MALTKRNYIDGETIITAQNLNDIQDEVIAHESNKVPTTRTVNSKALSSNITLSAADVGAVPTSRKVNNKALSADITLTAADVSAVPTTRKVNNKALSSDITLAAGDIGYNSSASYSASTVGKAISDLNGATIHKTFSKIPFGAKVSIIGDSITTFDGYLPSGYATYYPGTTNVTDVYDTWWMKAIVASGATLEVNASYSGSGAAIVNSKPSFYSRVSLIGSPDVILVMLGTNDASNNISLGNFDFTTAYTSLSETEFRPAYIKGMKALQATYPNAQIMAVIPLINGDDYRTAITYICDTLGIPYYLCTKYEGIVYGNVHPNKLGMAQLASEFLIANEQLPIITYTESDKLTNLGDVSIKKQGRLVTLSLLPKNVDIAFTAGWTILFKIPQEVRPSAQIRLIGAEYTNPQTPHLIQINNNGNVYVNGGSTTPTPFNPTFYVTYLV